MPCVDFIVMGEAEVVEDGCIDARFALLPNNPRRVLRRPIVLTSSGTSSDFTLPFSGLTSANAKGDATAPTDALPDTEPSPASSTDFVLQFDDVTLYSDNARCTHFVTDGLCSTKITNKDVLWMEKVADLSPGTLFKHLRESSSEPASVSELPWEPTSRYAALLRQNSLRAKTPRGHKSAQHLEENRRSDPLVHVWAWHDWHAEYAKVKASYAARVHQQALIDRAFNAHARRTTTDVAAKSEARAAVASAKAKVQHHNSTTTTTTTATTANGTKTASAAYVDKLSRGERVSSDSVIALLEIEAAKTAAADHPTPTTTPTASPTASPTAPPAAKSLGVMGGHLAEQWGERSPGSVMAMQGDLAKGAYDDQDTVPFALDDDGTSHTKGEASKDAPGKLRVNKSKNSRKAHGGSVEWSSWHVVDDSSTISYSDS